MKNDTYTATFTLVQDGLDGEVTPTLEFSPLVDPATEEAPAIYEFMSDIALRFLRQVNVLDDENNIIDPEGFDRLELDLSEPSGTKH